MKKYKVEIWSIRKLLQLYDSGNLNLNPPYQRNDIWTEKAQRDLVTGIKSGMPIPNFFIHAKTGGKFDIADGQQRTRAILQYRNGQITDNEKKKFHSEIEFLEFELSVQVIDASVNEEEIREFYVKVNKSGLKLNNAELTKAEFFNSSALKLVEELAELPEFKSVSIFTSKQQDRMIDREFIEELVAQIKWGITDKKEGILKLYQMNEEDFKLEEDLLRKSFKEIIGIIDRLQNRFDFSKSRYSQRNDFYTLFGLISSLKAEDDNFFNNIMELLFKIENDISPSNDGCEPLQDYALHCVSQSNSKKARDSRLKFMQDLLLNTKDKPNEVQTEIARYYELGNNFLLKNKNYYSINPTTITNKFTAI